MELGVQFEPPAYISFFTQVSHGAHPSEDGENLRNLSVGSITERSAAELKLQEYAKFEGLYDVLSPHCGNGITAAGIQHNNPLSLEAW
nr:hypothetical protein [Pseudomonas aeruginosa]